MGAQQNDAAWAVGDFSLFPPPGVGSVCVCTCPAGLLLPCSPAWDKAAALWELPRPSLHLKEQISVTDVTDIWRRKYTSRRHLTNALCFTP